MPNYSLVINSQFNPFSYQELLAPVQAMSNYHEKLVEEYDKLSSQADILEAMGTNDRDKNSGTYSRYKAYSDSLRRERDNLFANGLNYESRQRLSDLRRAYNTEIVPIQNAWQKREQEAQMQMKAQMDAAARGVNLYFSRDAANTSLQDYIDNPNHTFQILNGQQITTEIANQFKGLASQIQSDGKGNYFLQGKKLNPIEYDLIRQRGMNWNQFQDFANNPDDPRFANIRGIINNTLNAHGISNFSPDVQNRAFYHAIQGVSAGVGATDAQLHTDPYQKILLEDQLARQRAVDEAILKAQLAKAGSGEDGSGVHSLISTSEYRLPMTGIDFSNGKEQEDAMRTLGYVKHNGKLTGTGRMSIAYKDNSGRHTKDVSLFDKNGRIMSRRDFVSQAGNSKEARTALSEYFDKMVDAGKTLGIYGKMYTRKELTDHYNGLLRESAASFSNVYALNYDKNAWNTTSKSYPVREIKTYKGGKPVYDTKAVTLNDVLNMKDKDKNDANIAGYWTNEGNGGIILATTMDGKKRRFFIDASSMDEENIKRAKQYFEEAAEARKNNDKDAFIVWTNNALQSLHTGLTLDNEPDKQKQVQRASYSNWSKE